MEEHSSMEENCSLIFAPFLSEIPAETTNSGGAKTATLKMYCYLYVGYKSTCQIF